MQEADTILGYYERYCTLPLGLRAADPKQCSSAALREVCHRTLGAHKAMAAAYALGAQRQERQLRVRYVALLLWLCGAHDGVHCRGSGQRQARGATTTAHLHFVHRCILGFVRTSPLVVTVVHQESRRRVQFHGRPCERLLGGSRACCSKTQGSLLQSFDGLEGEPRVAECNTTWSA